MIPPSPPWDQKDFNLGPILTASVGAAGGYLGYRLAYPSIETRNYPRLGALQKIGRKHGVLTLASNFPSTTGPITKENILNKVRLGENVIDIDQLATQPQYKEFKGLIYNYDVLAHQKDIKTRKLISSLLPKKATILNLRQQDIGAEKWLTHKYLASKGLEHLSPRTISARKFLEQIDVGADFAIKAGGLENLILKDTRSSLQEGVWLDYTKIPESVQNNLYTHPERFMLQEKLKLQGEYRAITVGGKSVYTAHRFVSPATLKAFGYIEEKFPNLAKTIKEGHYLENIVPASPEMSKRISAFAERIAAELPMDISAYDIAHTTDDQLKLIEVQRSFGTFSNPIVNRRIAKTLTGKPSKLFAGVAISLGAATALGIYSFFNKDNQIEGLQEQGLSKKERLKKTDFGSGYQGTERPVISEYLSDLYSRGATGSRLLFDKIFKKKIIEEGTQSASVAADLAWKNFLNANHGSGIKEATEPVVGSGLRSTASHSPIGKGILKWMMAIGGGIFAWHLISGKDDDYNTIEGMSELGLASKQRKIMTDFGSGYDAMRAMAGKMGVSFEHLIETTGFQSALRRGTYIKKLGEGSFGVASLYKSSFRGEEFQFVRKKLKSDARDMLALHPEGKHFLNSLDIEREASILKKYGHTPSVPSLYGEAKDVMYMEHMPGKQLATLAYSKGGHFTMPDKARKDVMETLFELKQGNIYHSDIHGGNILFDIESGRASLIDFGQWKEDIEGFTKSISALESLPGYSSSLAGVLGKASKAGIEAGKKKMSRAIESVDLPSVPAGPRAKMKAANKALNKISGHQSIGMSSKKAELSSDFRHGASWKGLFGGISKKISKYMATEAKTGASLLLDPRKAAKLAEGKSLEEFTKSLGWEKGHVQIIKNAAQREQMIKRIGITEKEYVKSGGTFVLPLQDKTFALLMDPEITRQAFRKRLGKNITPELEQTLQSEEFMKTIAYHETLERQVSERFRSIKPVPWVKHASSQVLLGEAGFIQASGNQKLKDIFRFARRQVEEKKAFEAGLEAFSEEGAGALGRKLTTDFGSGYRGLLVSKSREISMGAVNQGMRGKMVRIAQELQGAQRQIWDSAIHGGKNHTRRRSSAAVVHLNHYSTSAR